MLIKSIRCCEQTISKTTARAFSDKYAKKGDYQPLLSSSNAGSEAAGNRPSEHSVSGVPFLPSDTYQAP